MMKDPQKLIDQARTIASRGRMDDADVQVIFDLADLAEALNPGKMYWVWVEGCGGMTGQPDSQPAKFMGSAWAKTFRDAAAIVYKAKGGAPQWGYWSEPMDGHGPRVWGCEMFDNERDARRSYG